MEILTKVRGEVDAGLARIKAVIEDMDPSGPSLGLGEKKVMGRGKEKTKMYSWPNGFKLSKNKTKKSLLGPKLSRDPVKGPKEKQKRRVFFEARSFHVGESSVAGELISTGAVRSAPLSILGNYEWVRMALKAEVGSADLGSTPMMDGESETGVGASAQGSRKVDGRTQTPQVVSLGSIGDPDVPGATTAIQLPVFIGGAASQGSREVDGSPQTSPEVSLGSLGNPGMLGAAPVSQLLPPVIIGGFSSGTIGAEQFTNEFQKGQGGGFLVEGLHSGVKDNLLVPSLLGKPIQVNGALRGPVEMLSSRAITISEKLSSMQTVGEGIIALPQQSFSSGLEVVPFVEEEPTPLDWSQALEVGSGSGSQEAGKEEDLIFSFCHIVGVSCDGQFDRLREAIALILAGKSFKPGTKSVGGGKAGRKGKHEVDNLYSSVNYEGGSRSVSRSSGKGRGNRICL